MSTHAHQPILAHGLPLDSADAAAILIHGRGATAESILSLVPELDQPGFAYLAPQAAGNTWYPYSFLEPIERNEPNVSWALARVGDALARITDVGIAPNKIVLLGFSQGACLALEFAARHARRFGAVVGLSGGLIGADDEPRDYAGSFAGTPVFLGCSDVDFHIPLARVDLTAEVLTRMGAVVDKRIYPGMGHTINSDEIAAVRALMAQVAAT